MRSFPKNSSALSHSAIVSLSAACWAGPSSISASSSITPASSTVFESESKGFTYARSAFVFAMTSLAFAWSFQKSPDACSASSSARRFRRPSTSMYAAISPTDVRSFSMRCLTSSTSSSFSFCSSCAMAQYYSIRSGQNWRKIKYGKFPLAKTAKIRYHIRPISLERSDR